MEIVTSCHASFRVSELSLLEFTAFIMVCPTSVHQLKRSEPYLTCLAQNCRTDVCPPLPPSNLLSLAYTEVRELSLVCTSKASLILLSHPVLSCLGSLILPWVHDIFYLLVKTGPVLSTMLSTLTPPYSLFPAWILLLKMEITPSQSQLYTNTERYWGLEKVYFKKNFILKKLNLLIRNILLKLIAP